MKTMELTDSEVQMIESTRKQEIYNQGFMGGVKVAAHLAKEMSQEDGGPNEGGSKCWDLYVKLQNLKTPKL